MKHQSEQGLFAVFNKRSSHRRPAPSGQSLPTKDGLPDFSDVSPVLTPLSTGTKAYIRTQHFSVTHTGQLQRRADTLRSLVAEFLVALEKAISRYAPELLPPENGA